MNGFLSSSAEFFKNIKLVEELDVFTVVETCNLPPSERGRQLTNNTTELLLKPKRSYSTNKIGGNKCRNTFNSPIFFVFFVT